MGSGAITQVRIDEAVTRFLTLKFTLGLFDQPCVRDDSKPCIDADGANAAETAGRPAALKAARESITLLRNENGALAVTERRRRRHRTAGYDVEVSDPFSVR